ncbi:MAG: NADH-ubiquinone oxidoreductase-F iron-sulfur binding region domain-containing protein [Spongiibacteraceae bacterium]
MEKFHSGNAAAIDSFYHLAGIDANAQPCQGLACFAARNDAPATWQQAMQNPTPLFCHGQCFCGPVARNTHRRPHIAAHTQTPVLLNNILAGGIRDLMQYAHAGGGQALQKAVQMPPQHIVEQIERSQLRGRGGAGFPTGRKWRAVAAQNALQKYVIANADEGDPGAFSDRLLMEDDPFLLIEAMIIAGIAVGAAHGFIYLRKEYGHAADVLHDALRQARAMQWLGDAVLGSKYSFHIDLHIGAGSYVCGEETAMLNSIEGVRPQVRVRPPHIAERGLFNMPTLVNNVETLCAVPWIIVNGADRYARMGSATSKGTKLISLNSLFNKPGLYEVELGISVRDVVDTIGGGLRRDSLKGVMIGGPLAGLVPPHLLDTPLCYEALHAIGCALGHGGIIAFGDDTTIAEIIAQVFRFGAIESCGKCTPCHLGSIEIAAQFAHWLTTTDKKKIERSRWQDLIEALHATSLCGHGRGLAEFAHAIERHYAQELMSCFA